MNILFVCSANIDRSRTAEEYFSTKNPHHKFRSAGTNIKLCQESASTPVDNELLSWADQIHVMEEKHAEFVMAMSKKDIAHKMKVLEISDNYMYMSPELIAILKQKVQF